MPLEKKSLFRHKELYALKLQSCVWVCVCVCVLRHTLWCVCNGGHTNPSDLCCHLRPCCNGGHTNPSDLCCHLRPWCRPCPGCCLGPCGTMVLPQLWSMLMFLVHVATKGHTDAWGVECNLWPWGCPRAMPPPGSCWSKWTVLSPGTRKSSDPGLPWGYIWVHGPIAARV